MKLELPEWLGPQRPNRTRGFLVVKIILFIALIVAVIETMIYIPIYYKILEEKAQEAPVGQDANVWVIALSTVLSVLFSLVVIAIGIVGVLKENPILVFIYASILVFGVILSLISFHHKIIVILSAVSNTLVAVVSYLFAYMIRKYDARG